MRRILLAAFVTALAGAAADGPEFTPDGQLLFPRNYREWVFLSSGLGMSYGPPDAVRTQEPNFDNVFVSRAAYASFLETGRWPDNTIFMLEVRASQSNGSINRGGRFQADVVSVEAEVKAGGKWIFYGFPKGAEKGKPIPATAACYFCHSQHGAVDNTFVQFYPTLLRVARAKGTLRE